MKCPSTGKLINCGIYPYSIILLNGKKLSIHATTSMNFKIIVLCEGSYSKNSTYCTILLGKILENANSHSDKKKPDQWLLGCGIWGHREEYERKITKGHEEIFESDGYIHYLDCDDSFTRIYINQKPSNGQIKNAPFALYELNPIQL